MLDARAVPAVFAPTVLLASLLVGVMLLAVFELLADAVCYILTRNPRENKQIGVRL